MLSDKTYWQKSGLFLLPLIDVRRDKHIKPVGTYVRDGVFTEHDYRLIVPFEKDESSEFHYYEKELLDSPYLDNENFYETDKHLVYVYNLTKYSDDIEKFLNGKYTKFSTSVKTLINVYWGTVNRGKFIMHKKVDAYLNPVAATYEKFSEELGVPVKDLMETEELLNPPDLEKETFHARNKVSKTKSDGESAEKSSF